MESGSEYFKELQLEIMSLLSAALDAEERHVLDLDRREQAHIVDTSRREEAHVADMQRRDEAHVADLGRRETAHLAELQSRNNHLAEQARRDDVHTAALQRRDDAYVRELASLREALETRDIIEQAKGVIMTTMSCAAEDAYQLLRKQSQHENRKLVEVAAEVASRAAKRRNTTGRS